ncbi:Gfo/Idh/MocA family protein [Alicyclobacillus mengziensis]|uniref:Gfo/Idh/MocA family protein n=1 Tax=Alicyclobacillus mengziensis TaxID=2931921 RepID=UPI00201163B2|nr:Gfo/Idh/MocA family oxidoreductase [Alicyclobacillus mengziensis]
MQAVKIGIIGCGNISEIYLKNAKEFGLNVKRVADIDLSRAEQRAHQFAVPYFGSVEELLSDSEVELVINLTVPQVHADVSLQVLEAGKHVYAEKPIALKLEDAKHLKQVAQKRGLLVGNAPDTFLGGGLQTCRKLIEDGWIGQPVSATAFMAGHGPESWHPNPEFFYQVGGGPMFDMGPYYLTALVHLMGPVKQVAGMTRITFPERTITSVAKFGQKVQVEIPTHVTGLMEFASGAIGQMMTSFDIWGSELPRIEVYGTEGTVSVPDPNTFGGPVRFRRRESKQWDEIPLLYGFTENSRGLGAADMVQSLRTGEPHRANIDLALHVLELMHGFHVASDEKRHYQVESTCDKPQPFPVGFSKEQLALL